MVEDHIQSMQEQTQFALANAQITLASGVHLPGRVLEACIDLGRARLYVTSHDILHEEQLDICLMQGMILLDRLTFARPFQAAEFANLELMERALHFTFPKTTQWELGVSLQRHFTSPLWPAGVTPMRRWRSHFTLLRGNR